MESLAVARWVDMKEMAAEAVATAKDKRLTIIPSDFEATWFRQAAVHLAQVQPLVCLTAPLMILCNHSASR